jgi:hypothetical protein
VLGGALTDPEARDAARAYLEARRR